jgi:hypothetical protein
MSGDYDECFRVIASMKDRGGRNKAYESAAVAFAKIKRTDLVSKAINSIVTKRLFGRMEINDWYGTERHRDPVREEVARILMKMGEVESANKFLKEVVGQTYNDEESVWND